MRILTWGYDFHVVITRTSKFSNEAIHLPKKECETKYFDSKNVELTESDIGDCELEVHANDEDENSYGWVVLKLRGLSSGRQCFFEGAVCISVRDVTGVEKFTRSFTFPNEGFEKNKNSNSSHRINYIKWETLLADPEDLLPNDTLTLKIGIHRHKNYSDEDIEDFECRMFMLHNSLEIGGNGGTSKFYLLLDSPLTDILSKESLVIQRFLETPMLESQTRRMNISELAFHAFYTMHELLLGETYFSASCGDIFNMYAVADMYDVRLVTETCIAFLKLYVQDIGSDGFSDVINRCSENETMAFILEKLKNEVCGDEAEVNENDTPKGIDYKYGWVYKGREYDDSRGLEFLSFENPYKSSSHIYK